MLFLLPWCTWAADLPTSVCDVMRHGAKADGTTNDAPAIQKAIDSCAASGGMVFFPAGNYLSGTIVLKSNVTLRLSEGATLWASKRPEDFKPLHLIYAKDAENITLEGDGTINGNVPVQGVYVYVIDYKVYASNVELHKHTKTGTVTLIK